MKDDLKLVYLVQSYPELYDPTHPRYTDRRCKHLTWLEIGSILDKDASECKRKWKSLVRECYYRALKKRESQNLKPFPLESEMDFIRPFMTVQEDHEFWHDNFTDEQATPAQPQQDVVVVHDSETDDESVISEIAKKKVVKRPAADLTNGNKMGAVGKRPAVDLSNGKNKGADYPEGFKEYLQFKRFKQNKANFPMAAKKPQNNQRGYPPIYFSDQSDNMSRYFQVIEETVRSLSPKLQSKVKAEISKIVYNAEYETLESNAKKFKSKLSKKEASSPSYCEIPYAYEKCTPGKFVTVTRSDEEGKFVTITRSDEDFTEYK